MSSLEILSTVTLNVRRPNTNIVVYAKQYDMASRIIDANLVSGNDVWDPPNGSNKIVMCSKPDGKTCIYDIVEPYELYSNKKTYKVNDKVIKSGYVYTCNTAINIPEAWNSSHWTQGSATTPALTRTGTGKVRVILAEQALTCPGNVLVSLCFYQGTSRSTTLSFIVNVEKSPDDNNVLKSSDYFNALSQEITGLLDATTHPPTIGNNGNWYLWDEGSATYVDSGNPSRGATGPVPTVSSVINEYALSTSGTTIPSSGWSSTIPSDAKGKWIWTRTTVTYNSGGSVIYYTTSYQGKDGQDGAGSPGTSNPIKDGTATVGTSLLFSREDHVHPVNVGSTTPTKDGTGAAGSSTVYARADHVHPLNTSTTNPVKDGTAAVGTSTAYARSDHVHPVNVGSTTPTKDGTGDAGSSAVYARADHVHPLNTSTTKPVKDGTSAVGTSTAYARSDHVHPLNTSSTAPSSDTNGGSAGSATAYARSDHTHDLNLDSTAPANLASSASAGSSNVYARRDHVHKFPTAANVGAVSQTVTTGTLTKNFSPDFTSNSSNVKGDGHLGILSLDLRYSTGFTAETWTNLFTSSIKPKTQVQVVGGLSDNYFTIQVKTDGTVNIFPHTNKYTGFVRLVIPFFIV